MATGSKIHLTPETAGVFHVDGITEESARSASELLQKNHERHHAYFNETGFHNHIVHHLLTLFALGASADQLQNAYEHHASYQLPQPPVEKSVVQNLSEDSVFRSYLGNKKHYHTFLVFYENEINHKGWEKALHEHVFQEPGKDGGRAKELFARLYSGVLHPIIFLGFGISFKQPAIIAEALAQAATHDDKLSPFLLSSPKSRTDEPASLFTLLKRAQESEPLRNSARWSDGNKLSDGVLTRAPQETMSLLADYHVPANASFIEKATAEMTSLNGYFTLTALRADKAPKVDFFYMHCFNATIFFRAFNGLPEHSLSLENKARLLEAKGKMDIVDYVSRASPPLSVAELEKYTADRTEATKNHANGNGADAGWDDIFRAVNNLGEDDGHLSKLIRAIASAAEVCAPYEEVEQWPLRGQNWLNAGKMVMDSVKVPGTKWVRGTGFDEAWENVPGREVVSRL